MYDTLPVDIDERLAAADDELLLRQLDETNEREASLDDRLIRIRDNLGHIAVLEGHRAGRVHSAAEVAAGRGATDPHMPNPELSRDKDETLRTIITTRRKMGRYATRFSIHGPNRDRVIGEATEQASGWSDSQPRPKTSVRHARRLHKQELRQANARHTEAIFGGGIIGQGQTAKLRTRLEKRRLKREDNKRLRNGDISADEFVEGRIRIAGTRKTVPVKAVRREVSRERRGATRVLRRADQPVKKRVRSLSTKWNNRQLRKTDEAAGRIQTRRELIEEELRRRGLLLTPPPVPPVVPPRPVVAPTPSVTPPSPPRPTRPPITLFPPTPPAPTVFAPPVEAKTAEPAPANLEGMPRNDILKAVLRHFIDGPTVGEGIGKPFPRMSPESLEKMLKNYFKLSDKKAAEMAPELHAELQDTGVLKLEYRPGEGTGYWVYDARAQELLDNPDLLEFDEEDDEPSTSENKIIHMTDERRDRSNRRRKRTTYRKKPK